MVESRLENRDVDWLDIDQDDDGYCRNEENKDNKMTKEERETETERERGREIVRIRLH